MQNQIDDLPSRLSDTELIARVDNLAASERDTVAHLVAHLAELETRGLHLKAGYATLFDYCRFSLHLSEHEAYLRMVAARASRHFPAILQLLATGVINLTSVKLLAPHLTQENHRAVLESARGKHKKQIEEIVAGLAPKPDAPTSLRKLPTRAAEPVAPASEAGAPKAPPLPNPQQPELPRSSAPTPTVPAAAKANATLLAPERYRLQLTIGAELLEKLRLAKAMLSHAIPSGDEAAVLDRALTVLLAELARKKFAATDRPRPGRETADHSRHISAEVRRAVWVRDLGRCAFVSTDGRRCEERRFVEFHHLRPYVIGGDATLGGVSLRCKWHNQYEASVFFARDESDGVGYVREEPVWYDGCGCVAESPTLKLPLGSRYSEVLLEAHCNPR
jgi:hypothetical protein